MTFFSWSMRFSLNGRYTSIKTQSDKLERVNLLKSDITKVELQETTLSNSGQHSLAILTPDSTAWLSNVQKFFVELSTYELLWLISSFLAK